jgi:hypothetical protein
VRAGAERHLTATPGGLAEIDDLTARNRATDVDDAGLAVDVTALQRLPLLGAKAGRGGEGGQRLVDR